MEPVRSLNASPGIHLPRSPEPRSHVEELAQQVLGLALGGGMAALGRSVALIAAIAFRARRPLGVVVGALDDLVELTAIKPHAAALGAVIDLDTLPLRHAELRSIVRTVHELDPTRGHID